MNRFFIHAVFVMVLFLMFQSSAQAGPFKDRRAAKSAAVGDCSAQAVAVVAPAPKVAAAAPCATATVSVAKTFKVVPRTRLLRVRSGC